MISYSQKYVQGGLDVKSLALYRSKILLSINSNKENANALFTLVQ